MTKPRHDMTGSGLGSPAREQKALPEAIPGRPGRTSSGYSLIEVLIAAAILAAGIAAAAILGMTMISQQEGAAKTVRALNYQEQAGRLFQLGVSPSVITNYLPTESGITSLSFTISSVAIANVGTVELAECTAVITISSRFSAGSPRTNTVAVIRPSIR